MRPDRQHRPAKATIRAKRRKHSLIHHFGKKLEERDGGFFCHYCGIPLVRVNPHKKGVIEEWLNRGKGVASVDHKQPLSRGGSNKLENMVLSCYVCNIRKGDSTYEMFIRSLKFEAACFKSGNKPYQPYCQQG